MRCPSCHQNIRIQGKFCPKCGDQIFGLPVRGEAAPLDFPSPPSVAPPVTPPPPPVPVPVPFASAPYSSAPPAAAPEMDEVSLGDYPVAPPSGPVLDISFEDTPGAAPVTHTPADAVGKVCPYCRFPIKAGEPVQICPSCGEPHHLDCWQENGGCTVYGCRSSPAMAGAAAAAAPSPTTDWPTYNQPSYTPSYGSPYAPQPALPREALALLEAELDRLATNALVFALLGFLGLTAVIGLLTGISVLGQISHSGLRAGSARGKAWAAVGLSVFWLVTMAGLLAVGAKLAGG